MHSDPFNAYRKLADDLYEGRVTESDLSSKAGGLPRLDNDLLEQLTRHTETFLTTRPRRGWALMATARSAADNQNSDLFLKSLSAWHMARACNHWAQPIRVQEAVSSARRGFDTLNEAGWSSACIWQENALAWTRPNFAEAASALKDALTGLEQAGFLGFVPECRLALAFAQVLIGEHSEAVENIRLSEEVYRANGDVLDQARCWLTESSSLRRRDRFEESFRKLEQALQVFEEYNSLTDQGRAHYQFGLGHLLKTEDLSKAEHHFKSAASLFEETELDLWHGTCISNLGSVYLFTGELALADRQYQLAEEVFIRHEIPGPLADNLSDHGEVNILRGRPQTSIRLFERSIAINDALGSKLSAAIVTTNLGKAYGQSGRYQDALSQLEKAAERLRSLKSYLRLGTCEKYAAMIWTQVGQADMAHQHLDRAELNYEMADQKAMLSELYNVRAAAFFQQDRNEEAIECLKKSMDTALKYGVKPQVILARRLLGEALARIGDYRQALEHLRRAQVDSTEMGMQMEMAAALVAMGDCLIPLTRHEEARDAFQQALHSSEGMFPESEWRAHVGLGRLAKVRSTEEALESYRMAVKAFTGIRQNFWQPSLAGSYLQGNSSIFDEIIAFAARENSAGDALSFIEAFKSSTLAANLITSEPLQDHPEPQELKDLQAEISFLQDQIRSTTNLSFPHQVSSGFQQLRVRLREKAQKYDSVKARLERQTSTEHKPVPVDVHRFDISRVRESARQNLTRDWIALDHYLTEGQLITTILGPGICEVDAIPLSHRLRMALDACKKAAQNHEPLTAGDLRVLGQTLIPSSLADRIAPETWLLLSPHRALHNVPWSALQTNFSSQPLVQLCIPAVTPSLHNLTALWQRDAHPPADRHNGLVVGLSTFGGRRAELPFVQEEIAYLSSRLGAGGQCLAEEDATWENLLKLAQGSAEDQNEGLSRFAWFHIASHFFSHAPTGRLNGLALRDGDVWLDKLRDLSPLPKLVTVSACNSISSFVYEGDEHVDLPSTCLAAGADHVLGSLWPVADRAAAEFTSAFYSHYLAGNRPAEAAAFAQREMADGGKSLASWAGFICIGTP